MADTISQTQPPRHWQSDPTERIAYDLTRGLAEVTSPPRVVGVSYPRAGLTFQNSFAENAPGTAPVQMYAYPLNIVELRGEVDASGATGSSTVVMYLPTRYRPARELRFPVWMNSAVWAIVSFTGDQAYVKIGTDGAVEIDSAIAGTASAAIRLDGIRYIAEDS